MQKKIQQITDQYLSNLPDGKEFYHLEDFKANGFPAFLVQHLELALAQKLFQSVSLPQTEWVDVQDATVIKSWQQFIDSLETAVRIPSDKLQKLLRQSVKDITYI